MCDTKNPANAASNRSAGSQANRSASMYATCEDPYRPRFISSIAGEASTHTIRVARGAILRVHRPVPHASSSTRPDQSNASTAASTIAVSRNQPSLNAGPRS